ncbi:MAG: hypothetical protein GTN62_13130 [Gemmatimonadales bacterium]|nr:hypothetical protein [Gemmatimonadales bacterium]NIN12853.1 hypothetical protein [Gemmatimonadales bacterium]NIN51031.1 hypothetical protein [Gemmatimonadales bacterium]NIP08495.1 hypothetical protein [Gemmatimonadales bacterium]NIR02535.1 hypothetical protein [Gemmatimonadales bacterium]
MSDDCRVEVGRAGDHRVEDAGLLLCDCLSMKAIEIRMVGNGRDAREALQSFLPDLVVLGLPVLCHGRDDVSPGDARRCSLKPTFPVTIVTAKELTSDEVRNLDAEVAAIVRKSDELEADLKRIVHRLLAQGPGANPTGSHPAPRRPA